MENTWENRGITVETCWDMGDYDDEPGYISAFVSRDGKETASPAHWTATPTGRWNGSRGCVNNYTGRVPRNDAIAETDETNYVVILLYRNSEECKDSGDLTMPEGCLWDSRVVPAQYFWVHNP